MKYKVVVDHSFLLLHSFFFSSPRFCFFLSLFFTFANPLFLFSSLYFYIHTSFSRRGHLSLDCLYLHSTLASVRHPQFTIHNSLSPPTSSPLTHPTRTLLSLRYLIILGPCLLCTLALIHRSCVLSSIIFFSHQHQKSTFIHFLFLFLAFPFFPLSFTILSNIHILTVCLLFFSHFCNHHSPIHIVLSIGTPLSQRYTQPDSTQQKKKKRDRP